MRIYLIISVLLFNSCIQHQDEEIQIEEEFKQENIEVKYAQGFDIVYEENYTTLITHSISKNETFRDSVLLPANKDINSDGKWIRSNISSLACQSSTHLAFLDVLSQLDKVSGLCGMDYVQNADVSVQLKQNNVREICLAEDVQMETLLEINPDLFLIYPFGMSKDLTAYEQQNVRTLFIAEYLEKTQLARLEWIKLFGVLMNRAEEANAYFEKVKKEYIGLKKDERDPKMSFFLNLPFKDSWFMPSAQSLTVKILEDAGMTYYYSGESGTENILHPKEEVWNDATKIEYWVIIANRPPGYSMADLLVEAPVYAEFSSVKNNKVIFCNTAESDYFSQGVVEPDVMLKDILLATGQLENHTPKYFRILE